MYKPNSTLAASFVLALWASTLSAAPIDTLTLTPAGPNTNFLITGTFGPATPTTLSSAPNAPYQLSFSLPTAPSTFAVVDAANEIFILNTVATLNGIAYSNSSAAFFIDALGGGVQVCLGIVCNPDGALGFATFDLFGEQLYTGPYTNPVFISGAAVIDSSESAIVFATPEPSSMMLGELGMGLILVLGNWRRRSSRADLLRG